MLDNGLLQFGHFNSFAFPDSGFCFRIIRQSYFPPLDKVMPSPAAAIFSTFRDLSFVYILPGGKNGW